MTACPGHFLTYPVDITFWRSRPVKNSPGELHFTRIPMSETSPLWQRRP
jgi:hypothetical protein